MFVEDTSFITCYTTKIRVILQYIGDSWLGKPKHRVEGVIYRYDDATENLDKIRDVPAKAVLARIEGSWMSQLFYTLNGSKVRVYPTPIARRVQHGSLATPGNFWQCR